MSRKRLGRADPKAVEEALSDAGHRPSRATAPIAQMAVGVGRSIDVEIQRLRDENEVLAGKGALYDAAETEGRVIRALPLESVDPAHIPRDRRAIDRQGENWQALRASLLARGQQVPVEVVDLGPGTSPRYGLVTGLRRLTALGELHAETGDPRFANVLALIRPVTDDPDKLIAMVEENEIRAGLSFYERGRIAALAAESGIFANVDAAIAGLFAASNRNRRYKIRCFVTVYQTLEGLLHHPDAIGERLGIALAKSLRAGSGPVLRGALSDWDQSLARPPTEAQELALLSNFAAGRGVFAIDPKAGAATPAGVAPSFNDIQAVWSGTDGRRVSAHLCGSKVVVELEGVVDVDEAGLALLVRWLGERMESH